MKKNLLLTLWMVLAMALATSCEEDPVEPTPVDPLEGAKVELSLVSADINQATVSVKTEVVKHIAYAITPSADKATFTAEELFATGDLALCEEDGTTEITFTRLDASTDYTVAVAARVSAKIVMEEVKTLTLTTADVPIVPVMKASLVSTTATTAELALTTEHISRYAYVATKVNDDGTVDDAPAIPLIFVQGTIGECDPSGQTSVIVENLKPNTDYVIYIAGEIAGREEFAEEIVTVSDVKTSDFEQDVRVYDITYNGFMVDIKVDPKVKELGHYIRWAAADYYNYMRGRGAGSEGRAYQASDAWTLEYEIGSDYWSSYFNNSSTIAVYEEVLPTDKNGNYVLSPEGEPFPYIAPITPGQPEVFFAGEVKWGEDQMGFFSYIAMFNYNAYGSALYLNPEAYFDQSPYWTGFYYNEVVQVRKPDLLDVDIEYSIEVESDEAIIIFEENPNAPMYSVMLLPSSPHYEIAMSGLNYKEEYLQWFSSSYPAMNEGWVAFVYPQEGRSALRLSDMAPEFISPDLTYYLYITAIGGDVDADGYIVGNKQKMVSDTFKLTSYTQPAPTVEVSLREATPYSVSYHIQCTSAAEGNSIKELEYLLNSDREWFKAGGASVDTARSLFAEYGGYAFSAMELDAINSADGYVATFYANPNTRYSLALKAKNEEGRVAYTEIVEHCTLPEPADSPVDIPALDGQWTMTATIAGYEYIDENHEQTQRVEAEISSTVTIGFDPIEMADEIPAEAISIYAAAGISEEDARAYYQELKEAVDIYISTAEGQNRIMLHGWDMDPSGGADTRYASPYDLFISDTYSGYNSVAPIYDFGPKWFMEFDANGNAWVPFNINYYYPMSSWTTFEFGNANVIQEYFMMAYNEDGGAVPYAVDSEGNIVDGRFPVEISDDGNTITIKGLEGTMANGKTGMFYPNMLYYNSMQGQVGIHSAIISDIVLTRGASQATSAAKMSRKATQRNSLVEKSERLDFEAKPMNQPKSRTIWPEKRQVDESKRVKWFKGIE